MHGGGILLPLIAFVIFLAYADGDWIVGTLFLIGMIIWLSVPFGFAWGIMFTGIGMRLFDKQIKKQEKKNEYKESY